MGFEFSQMTLEPKYFSKKNHKISDCSGDRNLLPELSVIRSYVADLELKLFSQSVREPFLTYLLSHYASFHEHINSLIAYPGSPPKPSNHPRTFKPHTRAIFALAIVPSYQITLIKV